jgi:pyruvate,water dikinase
MMMVLSLDELTPEKQASAGGKGATLARLRQSGYVVPDGFVVLPDAFSGDELRSGTWAAVQTQLDRLRKGSGEVAFAVRSSALGEDSARASFAGGFETLLGVRAEGEIREAIHSVRRSRHAPRVQAYRQAQGLDESQEMEMAVVVQQLVEAESSGVLFTADPVSGSRAEMVGRFVRGLGDRLVSGEASGQAFTLRQSGELWPRTAYDGPQEARGLARQLSKLGRRLERDLGAPQDVEWAAAGGRVYVLQSRPITTLMTYDPVTGERNDSLSGDFLWSNVNFGEAMPDVMTPLTWSVVCEHRFGAWCILPEHLAIGNIGGRPYLNLSIFASVFQALGRSSEDLLNLMEGTLYTRLPEGMEIPVIPLSAWSFLTVLRRLARIQAREVSAVRKAGAYLTSNPGWCQAIRLRIQKSRTAAELVPIWQDKIGPHLRQHFWTVLGTANRHGSYAVRLRRDLAGLVGPDDADTLLSSLNEGSGGLASLGPVVGLAEVAGGGLDRETYLATYGHRGAHECELSVPRIAEEPEWLERQLAQYEGAQIDVRELLDRQRSAFEAAWARLLEQRWRHTRSLRRRIDEAGSRARRREAVRSEFARDLDVARAFALRAGRLTGIGERVFFLTLDELLSLLSGEDSALAYLDARRETHAQYEELPPYPPIIRGRFDPFEWVAEVEREGGAKDSRVRAPRSGECTDPMDVISGSPGAAGCVEGVVRRLDSPEEGGRLLQGEILVTRETNVGWTPLFPRAAAIVTDLGAPLSHAAIVARELGVAAVVGCVDATTRLRSGDRVRVDGARGVVEILDAA